MTSFQTQIYSVYIDVQVKKRNTTKRKSGQASVKLQVENLNQESKAKNLI